MTDEEIKALAHKAGEGETGKRHFSADVSWLLAFARMVEAAERERCAKTPLTDEQVAEACGWKAGLGCIPLPRELRIARAIELAHGIGPNGKIDLARD